MCDKSSDIRNVDLIQKDGSGFPPVTRDQGLNDLNYKCDRLSHIGFEVKDLGQHNLASVSKQQLTQIDIRLLDNKCQNLVQFVTQQQSHTGFIPLYPLQFVDIKILKSVLWTPSYAGIL